MTQLSQKQLPWPKNEHERNLFNVIADSLRELRGILNAGISFTDNVDCDLVEFESSATPDAENTITHALGKVPSGYIVYGQDKAGSLYKGGTSWTSGYIYLKCSTASVTFNIIVF
jgi:hypothetical protein